MAEPLSLALNHGDDESGIGVDVASGATMVAALDPDLGWFFGFDVVQGREDGTSAAPEQPMRIISMIAGALARLWR